MRRLPTQKILHCRNSDVKLRRRCAFTLVELLVVISIIALLLAILLPSLSNARRQARRVLCLTRLSQLGVAVHLYANDSAGFLPQTLGGPSPWRDKRGALYSLVMGSGVYSPMDTYPELLVCPEANPRNSISYALNAVVFGYRYQPLPDDGPDEEDNSEESDEQDPGPAPTGLIVSSVKLSDVRNASKVVALYDVQMTSLAKVWHQEIREDDADISDQFTATGMIGVAQPNPAGFMWQKSLDDPPIEASPPHKGNHNVLFLDGHAAPHHKWNEAERTRLSGHEPDDSLLY